MKLFFCLLTHQSHLSVFSFIHSMVAACVCRERGPEGERLPGLGRGIARGVARGLELLHKQQIVHLVGTIALAPPPPTTPRARAGAIISRASHIGEGPTGLPHGMAYSCAADALEMCACIWKT